MSRGQGLIKGMARSDFEGFRYKPRETYWITSGLSDDDNTSNFALKREFENIAAAFNGLSGKLAEALPNAAMSALQQLAAGKGSDNDERVKINDNDSEAGHLADKLVEGPGVTLTVLNGMARGLALQVSVEFPYVCEAIDFNSLLDAEGKLLPTGDPRRLRVEFPHAIPHEHYDFDIYRPYEEYDKNTDPDYEADGTDRGRYQIRWKYVERKPNLLIVHFHQPEYGTVYIEGSSTIRRRSLHQA